MKIYAPVKDANGVYASVRFVDGVGETDNPRLIEWFKSHGYKVPIEESIEQCDQVIEVNDVVEVSETMEIQPRLDEEETPDFDSMTPIELREWANEHGLGMKIKNIRNKEKLLEIIRRG